MLGVSDFLSYYNHVVFFKSVFATNLTVCYKFVLKIVWPACLPFKTLNRPTVLYINKEENHIFNLKTAKNFKHTTVSLNKLTSHTIKSVGNYIIIFTVVYYQGWRCWLKQSKAFDVVDSKLFFDS